MTVLSTAERQAMERDRMFVPMDRRDSRFPEDNTYSEGVEAAWLAARDFYGPEHVAELERALGSAEDAHVKRIAPVVEALADATERERVLREALEKIANGDESQLNRIPPIPRPLHGTKAQEIARGVLAVSPEQPFEQPPKLDEVDLQRAAASTLAEGPCLVCGLLGMNKVPGGYLCASHFAEFEASFASITVSPEQPEGPVCRVCGDERILMEPDGSKAQPCYACQPAGTTLEKASRPEQPEAIPDDLMCPCGHTARWHAEGGKGQCEHDAECDCKSLGEDAAGGSSPGQTEGER